MTNLIRPATLKSCRAAARLSQAALARQTAGPDRVSLSTIKRIEAANQDYEANPRVVRVLAQALGVRPDDLAIDYRKRVAGTEDLLRKHGYVTLKAQITLDQRLAFDAVEAVYGLSRQAQIAMAPLFAALLAENSLAWRRDKLAQLEQKTSDLMSLGRGHLSFVFTAGQVEQGIDCEKDSIAAKDIFGLNVGDDAYDLGYDPRESNPFLAFIKSLAKRADYKDIALDPDGWGGNDHLPNYEIAPGLIEDITGDDYWAQFALRRGCVSLLEIPEALEPVEMTAARIEYLQSKIPRHVRAEHEQELREGFSDIDLDFSETADAGKTTAASPEIADVAAPAQSGNLSGGNHV